MSTPQLVTGDTTNYAFTCKDADGNAVSIVGASSVKLALVRMDRSALLAGPYTATSGGTGDSRDNWAGGTLVAQIPGADTSAIAVTRALIEVQVILAGIATTYLGEQPVEIVRGLIP